MENDALGPGESHGRDEPEGFVAGSRLTPEHCGKPGLDKPVAASAGIPANWKPT